MKKENSELMSQLVSQLLEFHLDDLWFQESKTSVETSLNSQLESQNKRLGKLEQDVKEKEVSE